MQKCFFSLLLIIFSSILPIACATATRETLGDSLQRYHEGVRWSRADYILDYIPLEKRDLYTARFTDLGEMRITTIDVQSVKNDTPVSSTAIVRFEWYLMRQAKVETSIVSQRWEKKNSQWWLVDERLIRGAPFLWLLTTEKSLEKSSNLD